MLAIALLFSAALRPGDGPVSVRLETAYVQPDIDASARGAGAGFSVAYRFTDQLSAVGGASESLLSVAPPAGGPRETHHLTMPSLGLEALFDATPIAPFIELCLVGLLPRTADYSLAARAALGADWRLARLFAIGLAVRTLAALDAPGGLGSIAGTEVAFRLTWIPRTR
ncbi:MAG TPA: hypothetical protein VG496_08890 [Myxococcales bacterium]|nr:hypothetical protein [Myxococcales bacterium]